jgi:ribosome biogenesis protein MAK21
MVKPKPVSAGERASLDPKDDANLLSEVKAFASQLGFLAEGGGGGDFDDFAPQNATKKIASPAAAKNAKNKNTKNDRKKAPLTNTKETYEKKPRDSQQEAYKNQSLKEKNGWRDNKQQQQQRRPYTNDDHDNDWASNNAKYVPSNPNAKSILARDEPVIWWEAASSLPPVVVKHPNNSSNKNRRRKKQLAEEAPPELIQSAKAAAEALLLNEEQAFEVRAHGNSSNQDLKWLQQARRSGTTTDKIAALTVLIQETVVSNLRAVDQLLVMANKRVGTRSVVGNTLDAMKELFVNVLLPPSRKLLFFEQQPIQHLFSSSDTDADDGNKAKHNSNDSNNNNNMSRKDRDKVLLYWLVEDGIKKRYASFVEAVEAASKDNLAFIKEKAVRIIAELLTDRPEAEQKLLSALINKLGDPDRKLASKAGYLITRLLTQHPNMKGVVVREVERFIFRPGLTDRARYYCVVYLNQMVLTHTENGAKLARKLVDIYFSMFALILDGKLGTAATMKTQAEEAAAAAASIGDKKNNKKSGGYGKKGKKGRHHHNGGKHRKQSSSTAATTAVELHTGEMDGRMLSALITGVRRAFPYIPTTEMEPLIEAHSDSLFRLIHTGSFGVATQALLLLFQLLSGQSAVSDRFYRALYAALAGGELTKSTKASMFLSLLVKAVKADVSHKRSQAFLKRLLQVAAESPSNLACGCLLIASELLKSRPALWNCILQQEHNKNEDADDDVERFVDIKDNDEKEKYNLKETDNFAAAGGGNQEKSSSPPSPIPSNSTKPNTLTKTKQAEGGALWPTQQGRYDARKRDPLYCNADTSCLWELTLLSSHLHPSVATMAQTLLVGANVVYDGDPLKDLTLAAFLDKFVTKASAHKTKIANASAAANAANTAKQIRGDSYMQPLPGHNNIITTTNALSSIAEEDVKPDEFFFHKFYSLGGSGAAARKKKMIAKKKAKEGKHDDNDDDEDDQFFSDDGDGYDSDAIDDFLAAEEEGGDEGIGADPDRSLGYDYADLAAAMDSDDNSDHGSSDDDDDDGGGGGQEEEEEESSGEEEDDERGDADADGSSSSSGDEDGDEDEFSLSGEEFSDMTDDDDEEEEEEKGGGQKMKRKRGHPSSSDDDADLSSDAIDPSSSDNGDADSDKDESDDDDAADAEVEALLKTLNDGNKSSSKKSKVSNDAESDSDGGIDPFQLASASSDIDIDFDSENDEMVGDSRGEGKKKGSGMSVFAPMEEFEEAIDQDELGGGDEEQEEEEEDVGKMGSRKGGSAGRKRGRQQGKESQARGNNKKKARK